MYRAWPGCGCVDLWEVCRVPDFQGVVTEGHTRLLSRVFRFLREPASRIPEDFLASHNDQTAREINGFVALIR